MLKSLMSGSSVGAGCSDALSPAGARPTGFRLFLMSDVRDEPYGVRFMAGRALTEDRCAASFGEFPIRTFYREFPGTRLALKPSRSSCGHPKAPADARSTGARGQATSFKSSPAARSISRRLSLFGI